MRRTLMLLTTMALALVMASGIALAESELDQQQTLTDGGYALIDQSATGTTSQAQTFTAGKTGRLEHVSLYVGCCADASGNFGGTPPPLGLMVAISGVDSSTGLPNWDLISITSIPDSAFSTDGSLQWVDVPLGGIVQAGEQYEISLDVNSCLSGAYPGEEDPCPPLSTSGYQWGRTTPSAYSGGNALTRSYSSGGWQAQDEYDFAFKTFVNTADTTAPDTTITSGPSGLTNDPNPTFTFSGSDEVTSPANLIYQHRLDGEPWSAPSTSTTANFTGLSEGEHLFEVRAIDEAGSVDASPAQQTFTLDSVAPTGTLTINDGASSTRTRSVTLTLSASDPAPGSGVTQMRISNTLSGLNSASWEAYANKKSWMLSTGSGTKTVYVQYRDAAENVSAVAQDMIAYKT